MLFMRIRKQEQSYNGLVLAFLKQNIWCNCHIIKMIKFWSCSEELFGIAANCKKLFSFTEEQNETTLYSLADILISIVSNTG